jgi:hypothetical protein
MASGTLDLKVPAMPPEGWHRLNIRAAASGAGSVLEIRAEQTSVSNPCEVSATAGTIGRTIPQNALATVAEIRVSPSLIQRKRFPAWS